MTLHSDGTTSSSLPDSDPLGWVDAHGDVLFRYAMAHVGSRDVAEDLVQETFVAALEARARYAGRSSIQVWLIGILRHKVLNHFRRVKVMARHKACDGEMAERVMADMFTADGRWQRIPSAWPADPSNALENQEFWAVFNHCLAQLPDNLRDAFHLREIEELDTTAACDLLGITPSNLAVRVHRARLLLRQALEQAWFTKDPNHKNRSSCPSSTHPHDSSDSPASKPRA